MAATHHTEIDAATKICTGCGGAFPATAEFFNRHPSGKFGFTSRCRKCLSAEKRAHYRSPKGKEVARAYFIANRDSILAYNKSKPPLTEAKREEGRRRASEWYANNKARARAGFKKRISTPEGKARNRVYQLRYQSRRLQRDSEFALRKRTLGAIGAALRQCRATARGRWWETACGYTLEELREHLEMRFTAEMTWENRGAVWEIDHIKPLSAFIVPDVKCEAFRGAWGLNNLRPLLKADNRAKGSKTPGQ